MAKVFVLTMFKIPYLRHSKANSSFALYVDMVHILV